MKHRLNLYTQEFAPTFALLSLNSLTASLVGLIVLFSLISAVLAWQNSQLNEEQSVLQRQVSNLQSDVDNAQQALATRQPDPKLVAAIDRQKLALNQRERLLKELSMREEVKNNRFSQVLADSDKADMPTVWLTTIHMSNDSVHLEGYGTRADAMPLWLANLSKTASFSGTDFQSASMSKQEQGLFFSLRTDLSGARAPSSRGQK